MTEAQRRVWTRAQRVINRLEPDVLRAVLAAFNRMGKLFEGSVIERLVEQGNIDALVSLVLNEGDLVPVQMPVRVALRSVVATAFKSNVNALPKGGKIDGTVGVIFDHLNPRVIDALRTLETRVISGMTDAARETVRDTLARGLSAQQTPTRIARDLRSVVGLAPNQADAVANFRGLLESGDREALTRALRDQRFDRTLEKALGANGTGLSTSQIDTMVNAYQRRFVAYNAETIAVTAVQDAYKIAARESWLSAIDRGIVDGDRLMKEWIHLDGQQNPRPEHEAMNGQVVGIDEPYSNGDTYAGEGDPWNCHCIDFYFIAAA